MERLSSCYFCGTALDEPLGTYLLGTPEPAGSVTLCRACHEKLDAVFDTVGVDVDLSEAEAPSPTPAGSTEGASDDEADGSGAASAWEPLDEARGSGTEDGDWNAEPEGEDESAEPDDGVASEEGAVEAPAGDDGDGEPSTGDGGDGEPSTSDDGEEGTAASDEEDAVSTDADDILVDLDADDTSDAGEAALGGSPDAGSAEEADPGSADGTGERGDSPTAPQGESGDTDGESGNGERIEQRESLTRAKFNKVIRLLQNREFPVDREQFVVVASNAYNLRRSECDKVIDVAIDRGILREDEESGELRRAE